jgi:hypothetical protein
VFSFGFGWLATDKLQLLRANQNQMSDKVATDKVATEVLVATDEVARKRKCNMNK